PGLRPRHQLTAFWAVDSGPGRSTTTGTGNTLPAAKGRATNEVHALAVRAGPAVPSAGDERVPGDVRGLGGGQRGDGEGGRAARLRAPAAAQRGNDGPGPRRPDVAHRQARRRDPGAGR